MDVALKGVAGQANYPALLLFRHNKPRAVVMDKLQQTPQESFVALAEHTEAVVVISDPGQRVVSVQGWRSARSATRHLEHDEEDAPAYRGSSASSGDSWASRGVRDFPVWADQLLRGPDREAHIDFWNLKETKRCNKPLVGFVRRLLPNEAGELKASNTLKFATYIRHVFYKASPGTWRNVQALGGHALEPWAKTAIVGQSGFSFRWPHAFCNCWPGKCKSGKPSDAINTRRSSGRTRCSSALACR